MIHAFILAIALAGPRYPAATDKHVNDFASALSAKDVERIRSVAQATLRDRGVPIVVATITSLADYDAADWSIERYATNLYNEWGIGDASTNKGVLLLVAVRDRKLRIATGTGLGNLDGQARQVIDGVIVPRFKSGDLSGGIAAGVEAIAAWFKAAGQTSPGGSQFPLPPPERIPGGEGSGWNPRGTPLRKVGGGGGVCCFVWPILIVVALFMFSSLFRRGGGSGGGSSGGYGSGYSGGGGGWGRFLLGGLAGFLGSQFLQGRGRGRQWGGSDSGGSILGGGSGGGFFGGGGSGGGSSFGGGSSSGGGASGSW
jgi:uncharacterized protein